MDKMKDNGFKLTKERSRRYPAQTITDTDYADDKTLLANTPTQDETLQHSLERAAAGIGLHVNADKTEYMCFNQRGHISTVNGSFLKLVDKFTFQGSSVSSTENDIKMLLAKAWAAIDWLSVLWKSDRTDKMKRSFFQAAVVSILDALLQLHKNAASNIEQVLEATPHKAAAVRPLITYHEKCDEPDMQDTAGGIGTIS